ncbi:MAG: hypothetical protein GX867_01420 [Tissierellia bacterium]|nr:hypothetical protein [Tissierellia bacterium]HQO71995.1 hypothetical protein [Sedimentibacter sp.]
MARRKRVYSRRRINYGRVAFLIAVLVVIILLVMKIFSKNRYISKVEEALEKDITRIAGSISTVSKIDATIYENEGIKYTNQHENIKRIMTFDGSLSEDMDKAGDVKILLENLLISEKTEVTAELPPKDDGYYWIEADIFTKDKVLIFSVEEEYNFDLYYDIENKTVYVKEKYYDEFSKKYNKVKFQGYSVTDEFRNIINSMANTGLDTSGTQIPETDQ